MNRFFIDLGEKICTLYAADRYIVSYEEFDYEIYGKTLDLIYAKMKGLNIEEVSVILHGAVSTQQGGTVSLNGGSIFESANDIKALEYVFRALGISKFSFFDFAGYYLFNVKRPTLFISQINQMMQLVVFSDGRIKAASMCTMSAIEKTAVPLWNKYNLREIIDAERFINNELLKYFNNISKIDEYSDKVSLMHSLALFAFSMTTASEVFLIDKRNFMKDTASVLSNTTDMAVASGNLPEKYQSSSNIRADIQSDALHGVKHADVQAAAGFDPADIGDNSRSPIAEEDTGMEDGSMKDRADLGVDRNEADKAASRKKNKLGINRQAGKNSESSAADKKTKRKLHGKLFKRLGTISMIIAVMMCVLSVLSAKCLQKKYASESKVLASLQNSYDTNYVQLSAYQRIDSLGMTTDNVTALNKIDIDRLPSDISIVMNRESIQISTGFGTKNEADDFVRTLTKEFNISHKEIRKDGKKWLCNITADIL